MKNNFKNKKRGQVIMIVVVFFLLSSILIVMSIISPLLRHIEATHEFIRDKQSYFTAEALNEDVLYRLNNSLPVPNSVILSLVQSVATATISNLSTGLDQIKTLGSFDLLSRNITSVNSKWSYWKF